jgi:N-dimethylarginine dimethylaminohydrolase
MVKEVDISIIDLDMQEIQKCDGALTCLSILF